MPEKQSGDFIENMILKLVEFTTPKAKKKGEEQAQKYPRPFSFRLMEMEETVFKGRTKPFRKEEKEHYSTELQAYKDDEMLLFKHLSKELHDLQVKADTTPRSDKDEVEFLRTHLTRVRKEREESKDVLEQIEGMLRRLR